MVPLNSPEHEASSQTSECASTSSASAGNGCCPQHTLHAQCNHLFNKSQDSTKDAARVSTSAPSSTNSEPSLKQGEGTAATLDPECMVSRRTSLELPPDALPSNSPTWVTAQEPPRRPENVPPEDSLQWLQALELQVQGACRTDERLRPLLRWNVSCFGSDGKLLAHLGQHFKGRELALLARCLCTPIVSLRVGKVSRHGRFLYPTAARGYLNLMLLPCSEMRLSFADDVGIVERVAITTPGVESGGILIQELREDPSKRTFLLKDRLGKPHYFWQSEKLKSAGDELLTKMKSILKRRPTLAHLTGIETSKLESFASYLRTAILSKASSALSQARIPSQFPSLRPDDRLPSKSMSNSLLPLRKSYLKLSTFKEFSTSRTDWDNPADPSQATTWPTNNAKDHIAPQCRNRDSPAMTSHPFESSLDRLRRCMNDIDTSVCSNGPDSSFSSSRHPATAKLIESLKRLRDCLTSLSDRRTKTLGLEASLESLLASSQVEEESRLVLADSKEPTSDDGDHLMKFFAGKSLISNAISPFASHGCLLNRSPSPVLPQLPIETLAFDDSLGHYPCPSVYAAPPSSTVVYRNLGPALDPAWGLQGHPVQYCPSVTKLFDFNRPRLISPPDSDILSQLFTQLVSQLPLVISHLSNETLCTHSLYIFPFMLEHAGASSFPHLSVLPRVLDHLRRAKNVHLPLPACTGYGVDPFLWKWLSMFSAPDQWISRWSVRGSHPEEKNAVVQPRARLQESGENSRKSEPGTEICHDRRAKSSNGAERGACRRCAEGTGLGNLVLVNYYAQQTGPRLRVITAEITSGNISYIVRFLQNF